MIQTKKIVMFLVCVLTPVFLGAAAMAQNVSDSPAQKSDGVISLQHYLINLSYDAAISKGQIDSITLAQGAANAGVEPTGGWRYDVVTGAGEVVNSRFIQVPISCQSGNAANAKPNQVCQENSQFNLALEIPFDVQAKNINVYDPAGKMIAFVDVSEFSRMCGDGVCQKGENYKTCAKDCRSGIKDGYCDGTEDGVCDPDCAIATDQDCSKLANMKTALSGGGKSSALAIIIITVILIAAAALVAIIFIKKKKGSAPDDGQINGGASTNPSQTNN